MVFLCIYVVNLMLFFKKIIVAGIAPNRLMLFFITASPRQSHRYDQQKERRTILRLFIFQIHTTTSRFRHVVWSNKM